MGGGYVPQGNAVADLDGNGLPDVAFVNAVHSVSLIFNVDGRAFDFDIADSVSVPSVHVPNIEAADLDLDGDIELVVPSWWDHVAALLENDGAGGFTTRLVPVGTRPRTIHLRDVTGDGRPDLVTGTENGFIALTANTPDGQFSATLEETFIGGPVVDVASGDLDGDGDPDVFAVVGDVEGPGTLEILRNQTPVSCPADVTGDGAVDLDDLLVVLADFACAGPDCAGDADDDGVVDLDDLLAVLSSWNSPCEG